MTAKTFISVKQAAELLGRYRLDLSGERVALRDSAGRVLDENIRADRDFPPYDRVMMDGIAIKAGRLKKNRSFRGKGMARAGEPAKTLTGADGCFEVMTGAVLPKGCDCVVPVEELKRNGNTFIVDKKTAVRKGMYIHRQGDDAKKGSTVLRTGDLLTPARTALLAACGRTRVRVRKVPRVFILSTGNEVRPVNARVRPFEVRASSRESVSALLRQQGLAAVKGRLCPDRKKALRRVMQKGLRENDVLLICGGISKGVFDLVPDILSGLKIPLVFRGVLQRPGRPFLFAFTRQGKAVIGLPGNPVSTLVTVVRYVVPYLRLCQGLPAAPGAQMVLARGVNTDGNNTYFCPVRMRHSLAGRAFGAVLNFSCSGDMIAWAGADGFVELPRGKKIFRKGCAVSLYRFA